MSVRTVSVMVPPAPAAPRGAVWVADAVARLVGGAARAGSGLPAWWRAASARLAVDRAARRDARGRAELLALASRYRSSHPEFAKDLLAAAGHDRA